MKRPVHGFTLVELAVVLVILGTMLTLGLAAFNAQITTGAYAKTRVKLEVIKDALVNHLGRHGYLPCPDIDFATPNGWGDRVDGTDLDSPSVANNWDPCTARYGIVPWRDLELSRDAVLDGWENFVSYEVSLVPAPPASPTSTSCDGRDPTSWDSNLDWTREGCFFPGQTGVIALAVKDAVGTALENHSTIAVMLVSHGENSRGAYTVKGVRNALPPSTSDEYENTDGDGAYVKRGFTENGDAGEPFDDLVLALSPSEIKIPLVLTGALDSEEAALRKTFARVSDAILGYAFSMRSGDWTPVSCGPPVSPPACLYKYSYTLPSSVSVLTSPSPPYLSGKDLLDAWGKPLVYFLSLTPPISISDTSPPGTAYYRLESNGPDRLVGTPDDRRAPDMTINELRAVLGRTGFAP